MSLKMPNIVLTSGAAGLQELTSLESTGDGSARQLMWEDLIYIADLSLTGEDRLISFRGDEPTKHPSFLDMTAYLLERGFGIRVFTNGIVGENLLGQMSDYLNAFPVDRISIYLSVDDFAEESILSEQEIRIRSFMEALGSKIVPTLSLKSSDFSLEPVVNLVNEYNLQRALHLTLAQPVPGRLCRYLEPSEIEGAVSRLFSFAQLLDRFRIRMDLDCTFIPCAFKDEHLAHIMRTTPGFSFSACRPEVTIGPDMTAWSCWTLPGFSRKSVFEFDSYKKIVEHFWSHHGAARSETMGAFIECDTCRMMINSTCGGGCLAHPVQLMKSEQPGLRDIAFTVPVRIEEVGDE